jgi:hypothetical protein
MGTEEPWEGDAQHQAKGDLKEAREQHSSEGREKVGTKVGRVARENSYERPS